MRQIVVGQLTKANGIQTINVWFRFAVPVGRQPFYTKLQASTQPQAPGDYAAADAQEVTDIQTGKFVERSGFLDVIDPSSTLATIKARLVNIYNAASPDFVSVDDASLSRWGTNWNGTVWTDKSA